LTFQIISRGRCTFKQPARYSSYYSFSYSPPT